MSEDELATALHRAELKYRLNDLQRLGFPETVLSTHRKGAVLLVAPHSSATRRSSGAKLMEFYTGSLAEVLGDALDCPVVTSLGVYQVGRIDSGLSRTVQQQLQNQDLKGVIELHGMSAASAHGFDVNFGTANMLPLHLSIARMLAGIEAAMTVSVDNPFSGARSMTAKLLRELDRPMAFAHLELSSRFRSDATSGNDIQLLISCIRTAFDL